ncbi:MAG TPA: hypothetical protein PLD78_14835 [Burkholderiaceae bacterium]|nr:hypothetical protein [Burkholderiaceae bacterium]
MSVASPRTARDALLAEILDEVDSLHRQVLALPDSLVAMEVKLAQTVTVLDQAADNFRMAVTAFSEQAKVDLLEFHERKTQQASNLILGQQQRAISELVSSVLASRIENSTQQIDSLTTDKTNQRYKPPWIRFAEITTIALIASTVTTGLLVLALKL